MHLLNKSHNILF